MKKELVIKGVEHVYDAFDEYEHSNKISLHVTDLSVSEAIAQGQSLLQDLIYRERRKGGFLSSGMFIAELTRIEDIEGYILFQNLEPVKSGLRYFGGDLEDHRDVAARFVFLSYSHEDTIFIEALSTQLEDCGLRIWLDRNDIETESALLRYGISDDGDAKPLRILRRAIDRANYLLLVISKHSVKSRWVEEEVSLASRKGNKVQVPIACLLIDFNILDSAPDWVKSAASSEVYDFSNWESGESWATPLQKMLENVFRYRGHKSES